MTIQITLGDMSFNNGTIVDDHSVYLEDNRFFRVQSQSNNTFTADAIYSCNDVWDDNTISLVYTEHILENFAASGIKVAKLGTNRFILFYYLNNDLKYRFIDYDINAEFNRFTLSNEHSVGVNSSGTNLYIYLDTNTNKLYLFVGSGSSVYRYIDLTTNTVTSLPFGGIFILCCWTKLYRYMG